MAVAAARDASAYQSSHQHDEEEKATERSPPGESEPAISNEYVLNIAFLSFLMFTIVQFFFALLASSQSMMADCAAMSVDVISYFVNFLAERLKHGNSTLTPQLRLKRLYLELLPPLFSVVTLVVVTIMALQLAIESLMHAYRGEAAAATPDVKLMLLFSGLNMVLDFLNVTCFARVDQAMGLPRQQGHEDVQGHSERAAPLQETPVVVAVETTPLMRSRNDNDDDVCSAPSCDVESQGLNLNMCSAWTHVCADTLRSVAVLTAAGFSFLFPELLTPVEADSWGAVVVSIIILVSLAPLLQGLYQTASKIRELWAAGGRRDGSLKQIVVEI